MFRTLEISGSGLTAQRLRMDAIAGNIAHSHTTVDENGEAKPFQRRMVVLETQLPAKAGPAGGAGVTASIDIDSTSLPRIVYEPGHPHADSRGYVSYPNINVITEFVNAMEATRAYEANLNTMQVTRDMIENTFRLLG